MGLIFIGTPAFVLACLAITVLLVAAKDCYQFCREESQKEWERRQIELANMPPIDWGKEWRKARIPLLIFASPWIFVGFIGLLNLAVTYQPLLHEKLLRLFS
jgi:hypothetical protein